MAMRAWFIAAVARPVTGLMLAALVDDSPEAAVMLMSPSFRSAQQQACRDIDGQDTEGDQQRAHPGKLHPVLEGRTGVLVNGYRQAGHRLAEAERPVQVAQAGEQQR